jgi:hypothetical protein
MDPARHRRQALGAGAAQGLKEKGLGLVAPVMGQEHEIDAAVEGHRAQRPVARLPRPGLDARARRRPIRQPMRRKIDGAAGARPSRARRLAVREPRVGLGVQAVVNVQRDDTQAERCRRAQGGVQESGRIAPSAVRDRDGALRRRAFSARWCR